jgi:hypothetical protein
MAASKTSEQCQRAFLVVLVLSRKKIGSLQIRRSGDEA